MSEYVINHLDHMISAAGQTLNTFGLDKTGLIKYTLNKQGFRSPCDFDSPPEYAFFGCSLVFGIGVGYQDTFASMFPKSHNYGVAENYTNLDAYDVIKKFQEVYDNTNIKKVVCWTHRGENLITDLVPELAEQNFIQFFCGRVLPYKNCYAMPADIDADVSQTHPGPKSHLHMYKTLCALFNR